MQISLCRAVRAAPALRRHTLRPVTTKNLCKRSNMDAFSKPDRRAFLDFARLSELAYSQPDVVESIWKAGKAHPSALQGTPSEVMCRLAFPPRYFDAPTVGAQCYVLMYEQCPGVDALKLASVKQGRVMVLDFRGTSDLADAMCDANLQQVPFKDLAKIETGKVHSGFYKQFRVMLPLVDQAVRAHLDTGNSLLCVGHSLGAALATLAAGYYCSTYPGQCSFVGYGNPRVGNSDFVGSFDEYIDKQFRVKNGVDMVSICFLLFAFGKAF